MIEIPTNVPSKTIGGAATKTVAEVLVERRASKGFTPEPVPDEYIDAILRLGTQAPSGYNLQPWRFIVVREQANREKLMRCAFNQPKVGEAPVVIIAIGLKEGWKATAEEVVQEGARRRGGGDWKKALDGAMKFLSTQTMNAWTTKHTMIAFTTMMYVAESLGLDTAPMEGFDAAAVKREFHIPNDAEVIALLAIGRAKLPDPAYGGRLELNRVVFSEDFRTPWKAE